MATTEPTSKNRDYITFLESVLDVCRDIKKETKDFKEIYFRNYGMNGDWVFLSESGWANSLCACVYHAIEEANFGIEVADSRESACTKRILIKDISQTISMMKCESEGNAQAQRILQMLDDMKNRYLPEKTLKTLQGRVKEFLEARSIVLQKDVIFDLPEEEITNYLETYYALLEFCLSFDEVFESEQERDTLITLLLNIDTKTDTESGGLSLSFRTPVVLNKQQKINRGIEDYFAWITGKNIETTVALESLYKRILLIKAQRDMRWYVIDEKKELLQAAVTPYVENPSDELKLMVFGKNVKQYNSYEGIGELRLAEKILYEYELLWEACRKKEKTLAKEEFHVALLGDIYAVPLMELHGYVVKKIKEKHEQERSAIFFHVYTKNELADINMDGICVCGHPDEILLNREKLGEVLKTNQVVFILDCIELYKSPTVTESENLDFIKQKFIFRPYNARQKKIAEYTDVCEKNALEELYEYMVAEQYCNKVGRIGKTANRNLLLFCEELKRDCPEIAAMYIYVSDMNAFSDIYNDNQYYIRTERYHQKEIGIIRYSDENVNMLPLKDTDKVLVFNVWQFLKNVALEERKNFLGCDYKQLDKIYVGIDYAEWPKRLLIHTKTENEMQKTAQRFVQELLLPFLNDKENNMFSEYIRKAMCSFLYSAAKNVQDMLFVHLFQDKERLVGRAELPEQNDEDVIEKNINRNYKYSIKRFYDMIMRNYDISAANYIGQIRTAQIIQKNEERNRRISKKEIYGNVIKACEDMSYKESFLVENCKRELEGKAYE